jgi:hypothetical protein
MAMIILSQRNSKWSSVKLGKSQQTVGKVGCVTTDISMGTSYFGTYFDPGVLASKKLEYTSAGLILWQSVKNIGLKFVWRGYPSNFKQSEIDEALKNPKRICLLNVDSGAHWVLGISRVPFTTKYLVADPWSGSRKIYGGVIGYSIIEK